MNAFTNLTFEWPASWCDFRTVELIFAIITVEFTVTQTAFVDTLAGARALLKFSTTHPVSTVAFVASVHRVPRCITEAVKEKSNLLDSFRGTTQRPASKVILEGAFERGPM